MEKCVLCDKEFTDNGNEICKSCLDFFGLKYGKDFRKRLGQHKKYRKRDANFNTIKFRRKKMKSKLFSIIGIAVYFALIFAPLILAVDFDQDISAQDQATFDEILEPVMKIYNLIKYSATVLAVIVLLFAGISYMISGSNPGKREKAKNMAMYVLIGLVVIWAAPLVVNFIVG